MTWHRIIVGDVLDGLRSMEAGSCRCCVTSPPYWGLRDYGTATWEGGDAACDHKCKTRFDYPLNPGLGATGQQRQDSNQGSAAGAQYRDVCRKCGARRIDQQIGLEPTPELFIARLVEVFREVRRVLTDDGTAWVNMGDSYAMNGLPGGNPSRHGGELRSRACARTVPANVKPKDIIGVPWLLAFALRADGWYLRQDIIWAKPNPMPESVTDRCTKSHEYLFLLSKNAKYFYDAEAIAEPSITVGDNRAIRTDRTQVEGRGGTESRKTTGLPTGDTRNARTVWTIATQPYSEAHFATFPEELPRRCIKAGSTEGDTILDPFVGSGTTLAVARSLGRNGIGCELNPDYAAMAEDRIGRTVKPNTHVSKRDDHAPLFGATQ